MSLLGRFPALESDVEASQDDVVVSSPEEGVDDTGAQLDGENIVEGDLMEAEQDQVEIDQAVNEEEELTNAEAALESFLAVVQSARKGSGLSAREAAILGIGMENSLVKLDFKGTDLASSLESYNPSTDRERLTQTEALESKIKDILIQVWEAIKRAVNKVVNFVRKWFIKIFDGAVRLKKRAQALRKKADNTSGTIKEKKITTSVLTQLHVNKKMPAAKDLINATETVTSIISELTKGRMDKDFGQNMDNILEAIDTVSNKDGKVNAADVVTIGKFYESTVAIKEVGADVTGKVADQLSKNLSNYSGGTSKWVSTSTLPGHKLICRAWLVGGISGFSNIETNHREVARNMTGYGRFYNVFKIINASDKVLEVDNSTEVPTLSSSDVSSICSAVESLCDVVIDYKKGFENYSMKTSTTLSKLDNTIKKIRLENKDADERQRGEITKALATMTGDTIRNKSTSINTVVGYGINLCRNLLVYGHNSLAQYKDN